MQSLLIVKKFELSNIELNRASNSWIALLCVVIFASMLYIVYWVTVECIYKFRKIPHFTIKLANIFSSGISFVQYAMTLLYC